jgi:hypothetical protein
MHLREELPPRGNDYTDDEIKQATERIPEKTVAYGLLVRADRERYGKLIKEIENDFLEGHNDYPKTPTEAYNLLVKYRNHVTVNKRTANQSGLDQVAFVTEGKKLKGEGGKTNDKPLGKDSLKFPDIKCFKCGKYGHYKSVCFKIGGNEDKEEHQTETALMTLHVVLAVMKVEINPMWILCDNESTVDIFKNRQMVTNIYTTSNPIQLKGIKGNTIHVEEEGDLLGYGTVYFNENVTANVLSFYNMAKKFKSLTYDNTKRDAFVVTRDDDSTFEFIPSPDGLYYYDFSNCVKQYKNILENQYLMVIDTVDDLKRNFTKREITAADVARRLYVTLGRPSQDSFENIIHRGQILNNPITISDYRNALTIHGKNLGSIKGKTIRSKPHHVQVESGSPEKL